MHANSFSLARLLRTAAASVVVVATTGVHADAAQALAAQARPEHALPRDSLLADFDLLIGALKAAHPRLHHYRPEAEVSAAFAEARDRLDRDMTVPEFYRVAAQAVAAVDDGHTQLGALEEQHRRVMPFDLLIEGERAWVSRSYGPDGPAPGAEVVAINGRSIDEVLAQMRSGVPRDYGLESGKRAVISERFASYYADLVGSTAEYELTIRREGGRETVHVAAMPRTEVDSLRREALRQPPIAWRMLDDATAYIDLNTFNNGNFEASERTFAGALDSAFQFVRARGADALILDIRGNGGGQSSNGALAASYLLDAPFRYLTSVRATTDVLPVIAHTQWAEQAEASQAEYASILARTPDGKYEVTGDWYPTRMVEPAEWTLPGDVYVLTDGRVSSTGSDFAAILHAHGRATFVGEMIGGSYDGNASGVTARIRLPHTGVRLFLPLFDFTMASGPPPHPSGAFPPDVPVQIGIDDLLAGRDPVLAAALNRAATDRRGG